MSTVHSPRRTRARAETPPTDDVRSAPETASLGTILEEMRKMREEQARRETELTARLRQLEDELLRQGNELSPSILRAGNSQGGNTGDAGEVNMRAELGIKLKPDTFDGRVPLREFLSQFSLIARANKWDDATQSMVLAASLRGKARTVLETIENIENLNLSELTSKLELLFGEGSLTQNYYSLFTNRRQKFGEDLATFGTELERLSRLAYPECPYAVRDKIACAQFISTLSDNFVKRTLQLEGITSLNLAIERAKAVKIIQEEDFGRRKERRWNTGNFQKSNERDERNHARIKRKDEKEKHEYSRRNKWHKSNFHMGNKECWTCGKKGHFRSECPEEKGNLN